MRLGILLPLLFAASPAYAQDTLVIRTNNPPIWGSNVRAVRELRIGEVEGPEEFTFGRVAGVAVDARGGIFVLDAQVPTVRQFTANGKYVRSLGRRGQGPGELGQPEAIGVAGDRLIVRDTRYGPIGTVSPPIR